MGRGELRGGRGCGLREDATGWGLRMCEGYRLVKVLGGEGAEG